MLDAGIDVRSIWQKEAGRASGFAARNCFQTIHEAVARGDALREALDATGSYFPPLFREIVGVGEQTGRLSEAFRELADHYDSQVRTARIFWAAIIWPAVELALLIAVIGLLIWIQGMLPTQNGKPFDILGWGLVGNRGLVVYLSAPRIRNRPHAGHVVGDQNADILPELAFHAYGILEKFRVFPGKNRRQRFEQVPLSRRAPPDVAVHRDIHVDRVRTYGMDGRYVLIHTLLHFEFGD